MHVAYLLKNRTQTNRINIARTNILTMQRKICELRQKFLNPFYLVKILYLSAWAWQHHSQQIYHIHTYCYSDSTPLSNGVIIARYQTRSTYLQNFVQLEVLVWWSRFNNHSTVIKYDISKNNTNLNTQNLYPALATNLPIATSVVQVLWFMKLLPC